MVQQVTRESDFSHWQDKSSNVNILVCNLRSKGYRKREREEIMCIFYGFFFYNLIVWWYRRCLCTFSPLTASQFVFAWLARNRFRLDRTEWIELGAPRGKIKWISWTQNDKRKPFFFCSFLAIFIVMYSLIMLFIARTENWRFVLVDEKNVANQSVWSSDLAEISARHCFEWIFRVTMHRTLFVWVYICASERMSECAFWMCWLSNLREFAFIFIHVCVISVCDCRWYDYLRGERLSSVVCEPRTHVNGSL